jgi:hypothetical protein
MLTNVTAIHAEMALLALMESTNTPALACQDTREFIVKQTSTSALLNRALMAEFA